MIILYNKILLFTVILVEYHFTAIECATRPQLYEGDECNMGNRKGICTRESKCTTLEEEVKSNKVRPQDVYCGTLARESVVCCRLDIDSYNSPKSLGTSPAKQACDDIQGNLTAVPGSHVINGVRVDYGEFPFLVGLGYYSDFVDGLEFRCGGSLIDRRYVLTAAHCIFEKDGSLANITHIRVGVNNLDDIEEIRNGRLVPVKKTYPHCEYFKQYNDIAIIELESDAFTDFNHRNIRAACIALDDSDLKHGENVIVAGWGHTNSSTRIRSNILLKAGINIIDIESCNKTYANVNGQGFGPYFEAYGLKDHLCAHDLVNTEKDKRADACQGDSGGPLIHEIDAAVGDYRIVGIISSGYGCGIHIPGLFTRVSKYTEFIENIVWRKQPYKCPQI